MLEYGVNLFSHRAVEVHGKLRNLRILRLQRRDRKQDVLRAFDGKCGNHNCTAARDAGENGLTQVFERLRRMHLICIRRFTDQIGGCAHCLGIEEQRTVVAPEIAGKHNALAFEFERRKRRTDDVSGVKVGRLHRACDVESLVERNGLHEFHCALDILRIVVQRRRVGALVLIPALLQFLLQIGWSSSTICITSRVGGVQKIGPENPSRTNFGK